MKKAFIVLFVLLALGVTVASAQQSQTPDAICAAAVPAEEPSNRTFSAPDTMIEPGVDYRAVICTEAGAVYVDLYEDYTPAAVNSFIFLADSGYFNNITFHRVLEDFMAQGGDPTGTGTGTPGYTFLNEPVGFLHFDQPGWLAMANAGQDNTNGSQFFITTVATPGLDYQYTIFGKVLQGQENVEALKLRDPDANPDFEGSHLDTVVIVTDPASVATDYVAAEPATEDDMVAAFTDLAPRLVERYSLSTDLLAEQSSGLMSTDDVVATVPESQQAAYAEFLDRYHHQYRVSATLDNTTCTADLPFVTTTYALDVFASAEDAQAALEDGFLNQLPLEAGFAEQPLSVPLPNAYFTAATTGCDGDAVHAITYWQRGRFVATVEATIQATYADYTAEILSDMVGIQIFEYLIADVLRAELP